MSFKVDDEAWVVAHFGVERGKILAIRPRQICIDFTSGMRVLEKESTGLFRSSRDARIAFAQKLQADAAGKMQQAADILKLTSEPEAVAGGG